MALIIESSDIREKILERKTGNTILFVVDASGSMGARKRMSTVKGAILSLLIDAYQKRDKVGMVIFRGNHAELLLPLTSNINLAEAKLRTIPTGGKTPLAQGLQISYETLMREKKRDPKTKPLMILISDGKANVSMSEEQPFAEAMHIAQMIRDAKIPTLLLDSEEGFVSLGYAKKLADALDAKYMKLEDIMKDPQIPTTQGIA